MTPSIWQALIVFLIIGLPVILGLIFIRKKEYSALSENQKYAGFWNRVLAGIIDLIILAGGGFFIGYVLGVSFVISGDESLIDNDSLWDLLGWIITFLYYVLFQSSSKQGTPGMMALNIKIYDEQFQRVGFWKLTHRFFSTIWSIIFLLIGFFMIGWTKRKQGFHDLVARTIHLKE